MLQTQPRQALAPAKFQGASLKPSWLPLPALHRAFAVLLFCFMTPYAATEMSFLCQSLQSIKDKSSRGTTYCPVKQGIHHGCDTATAGTCEPCSDKQLQNTDFDDGFAVN